MRFVYAVVVVGAIFRLILLIARPSTTKRFHQPRRRLLAHRFEQAGDAIFLVTAVCAFLFGRHSSLRLGLLWMVGLVTGFAMVAFAHEVARRYRPAPPPPAPPRTSPRQRHGGVERPRQPV